MHKHGAHVHSAQVDAHVHSHKRIDETSEAEP